MRQPVRASTTAQVLALEPDPAGQYNGQTGGNPNLRPETADTYTVGLVWQPTFLPGFNLTVDYFNIEVKDYISNIGANVLINGCVNGTNPGFCPFVHRDAIGSIKSSQGFVIDTVQNQGGLKTSGVDVSAGYHRAGRSLRHPRTQGLDLGELRRDRARRTGHDRAERPTGHRLRRARWIDLLDRGRRGPPEPRSGATKARLMPWNTPFGQYGWFGNLRLSAQWRYFSSVDLDATSSQPALTGPVAPSDAKLGSRSYLDLLATFKVKDNYSFRIGVNNVLDQDPPLAGFGFPPAGLPSNCPAGACNQNVYSQMYDTLGRYIFVGLTADF